MLPDEDAPAPTTDAVTGHLDPDALKGAHGRTGRMLKTAGLPFEDEEFTESGVSVEPPEGRGEDPAAPPETA